MYDEMCFAQYNSALMVFHLYLIGILDIHGVGDMVFFLCTRVSISYLTHHIIHQWYFSGGNFICHPHIVCKILARLVPRRQSPFRSNECLLR